MRKNKIEEKTELTTNQERVIKIIQKEKYKLDDDSEIDEERWESDYPKWKDRIDFAAGIIDYLEKQDIFVLLFSNGYYLTVNRPGKIYEDFRLSVLNLDLNNTKPLMPYVKDAGSGLSYKTENREIGDFVDLFLWATGDLEADKCRKVLSDLGSLEHVFLTEKKIRLSALIKIIDDKIDNAFPDMEKDSFYKLDKKGSLWESINPSEIVSKLESEGPKFERTLWLAIKRHEKGRLTGKIKNFELIFKNEDQKNYNKKIKNNCLFFNENECRPLDKNNTFEYAIFKAVREGLLCIGYEEENINEIKIDNQGIIKYSAVRPIIDKNGEDLNVIVNGYLGQVLFPDEYGLVKTKHHIDSDDDYWFVPGYYAFCVPNKDRIEENTKLHGFQQMLCTAIRIQMIRDSRLVYDYSHYDENLNCNCICGDETNINDIYSLLYDERFDYDPLGDDIREYNTLPKDIRKAIVKTLARKVRYPEYLYKKSGVNTLLKDEESICIIRNTKIFDPEATSSGKNQGLVRYLVDGAIVESEGRIIPNKKNGRTPIFNHPFLSEYSKYNPFDRNQMVFSNLMKAFSITTPSKTALTTCGGWNMEDGFVISKDFAHKNQVPNKNGGLRDLMIGDKMLDRGGNKGVIAMIVDPDSDDKSIAELIRLFRENPELDVVASPYSGLSRFNGATARELMKETSSLFYNGEEHKNCIGTAEYIITRHFVDKKTHIYDEEDYEEGRSRKASPQLSWALCSKDAKRLMSYLYAEGARAEGDIKDVTALMYYKNDFMYNSEDHFYGEDLKEGFDVYSNKTDHDMIYFINIDNILEDKVISFCLLPYSLRKGFRMVNGKKVESKLTRNYQSLSDMLDKENWNSEEIEKQIKKINGIFVRDYFKGKKNMFKTLAMTRAIDKSTTAIWTPDPRLSIESISISREISDALDAKENDWLLIWRDPILRDAGVRYMKVEKVDDNLTGIAINPVVAKGFDGDFDGDTVAVVKISSRKADLEAREKFSVENNLFDEGKPGEQLIINTKLDLISSGLVLPELKSVSNIDNALQELFKNDFVLANATINFSNEESVIDSLRTISESKAKGGSLSDYEKYFKCRSTEGDRLAVQKATAIKAAVGIAGRFSQQLMRAFRDNCPKAVLEITYPNTQALLQAKHDPERAVNVYKILKNDLMYAWNDNSDERRKKIEKIYQELGQVFGKEIDEKYLDEICSALGNRKLKECRGAFLDEFAYNDKFDYSDANTDGIDILKKRNDQDNRTSDSKYCRLFFEEYDSEE